MRKWYVMQVRGGTEHQIQLQCRKQIPGSILEECFIPVYEEKKRLGGEWKLQKKILFPGYVFAVTEEPKCLIEELRKVSGYTRVIGTGNEIVPLSEEEVTFLEEMGGKDQVVQMSEGVIENEKVIVRSGPLRGKEGYIRKIDRHKRKAILEVEMFGRLQRVEVGLEIVSKT